MNTCADVAASTGSLCVVASVCNHAILDAVLNMPHPKTARVLVGV